VNPLLKPLKRHANVTILGPLPTYWDNQCAVEIGGVAVVDYSTAASCAMAIAGASSFTVFGPGLPFEGIPLNARSRAAWDKRRDEFPLNVWYAVTRLINASSQVRNETYENTMQRDGMKKILASMPNDWKTHWVNPSETAIKLATPVKVPGKPTKANVNEYNAKAAAAPAKRPRKAT